MTPQTILDYWFIQLSPEQWWKKDPDLDQDIRTQFSSIHHQAISGELSDWRGTAEGCLAEIIILDQFSRNIFRDNAQSFAYDGMALVLAQEAIRHNMDQQLTLKQKPFLYLPFMHSESLAIHQQALELYSQPGLEFNLEFEKKHLAIIKQFGRYPHRNIALSRQSTKEEQLFVIQNPGF